MSDSSDFRELLSGQRRGLVASLFRGGLFVSSGAYSVAVSVRNRLWESGLLRVSTASVPVVSIGNLTVGGTGKSPMVLWIARWLISRGIRPAIVSRGYHAAGEELNDEGQEIRMLAPHIPQIQNSDRVLAAQRAISEFSAQAIVLDDGFQHRRLERDVDIVLIDATNPFGYGHLLPRGLLREPISSLRRADFVILTRADRVSQPERDQILRDIRRYVQKAGIAETRIVPIELRNEHRISRPLTDVQNQRVFGFAAIGNPEGFRQTVESLGCSLVGFKVFPDHYRFTTNDWEDLVQAARAKSATMLICTGKDLVKSPLEPAERFPLRAVMAEVQFLSGKLELEQTLTRVISPDIDGVD